MAYAMVRVITVPFKKMRTAMDISICRVEAKKTPIALLANTWKPERLAKRVSLRRLEVNKIGSSQRWGYISEDLRLLKIDRSVCFEVSQVKNIKMEMKMEFTSMNVSKLCETELFSGSGVAPIILGMETCNP